MEMSNAIVWAVWVSPLFAYVQYVLAQEQDYKSKIIRNDKPLTFDRESILEDWHDH